MRHEEQLIVFVLNQQCYALSLASVQRVVRAVEITPLPKAPEIVSGVINVQGQIVPVINVRKRFRLPERDVMLDDQIIVARTSTRPVALMVDAVNGVVACAEHDVIAAEAIVPGMEFVQGVAKLKDGMILIHDLDRFLSLEEEQSLDQAMADP